LEALYRHLEAEHHFRIDPRRTVLTGLCQTCGKKEAARGAE
jgi:Fur family ferric uptake transcriptional regulator